MTSSHVFKIFVSVSKQSPILELLTYHDFLFWYFGGGLSYRCKQDSPRIDCFNIFLTLDFYMWKFHTDQK